MKDGALPDLGAMTNESLVAWYDEFVCPAREKADHARAEWGREPTAENARTLNRAEENHARAHRHWWIEFSRRLEQG